MALIVPGRASCLQDAAIFTHFDASLVERLVHPEPLAHSPPLQDELLYA